jgi:hypothetical protein
MRRFSALKWSRCFTLMIPTGSEASESNTSLYGPQKYPICGQIRPHMLSRLQNTLSKEKVGKHFCL